MIRNSNIKPKSNVQNNANSSEIKRTPPKPVEEMSFDEAITLLEEKISILENENPNENSDVTTSLVYQEAMQLREHCSNLLKKEREEIVKIAQENNIPLNELGLEEIENDNDLDEDYEEESNDDDFKLNSLEVEEINDDDEGK